MRQNSFFGFGILRFLLAEMVLSRHLYPTVITLKLVYWADLAVVGFFCISGFFIAAGLNWHYQGWVGTIRFIVNRLIRLIPANAFVIVLIFCFFIEYPPDRILWGIDGRYIESYSFVCWIENLLPILPNSHLINTVAWSLRVELWLYFSTIIILRNKWLTLFGCFAAFGWNISRLFNGGFDSLYPMSYSAMVLPFLLGSAIFHFKNRIPSVHPGTCIIVGCVYFGFIIDISACVHGHSLTMGIHVKTWMALISIFFMGVFLSLLQNLQIDKNTKWRKLDKYAGELSYPLYLIHFPLMTVVMWNWTIIEEYASPIIEIPSLCFSNIGVYQIIVLIFSHAIAIMIYEYIEHPLKRLRQKVRSKNDRKVYDKA